jgi:tetratricopeptide (TPR) repeat protein
VDCCQDIFEVRIRWMACLANLLSIRKPLSHPHHQRRRTHWIAGSIVGVFVLAGSCALFAQMQMPGMGETTKEISPPEQLPVPVQMSGIGNSYIKIKASAEAQMWFEQGLNLLHDFWGYEAERAFEQAVRVDPKCAMCYWGLYQALPERYGRTSIYSDRTILTAKELERYAGKTEKLYIEAAVAHHEALKAAGPKGKPDFAKEVDVLRRLVRQSPTDPQARIFLAIRLDDDYDDAGAPNAGTREEIALLKEVLKQRPDDSAANHYWIHAVEASSQPQQALVSAAMLPALAPSSGHMVHMPGHIFYRVGDYAQAERWFARSTEVDESYLRTQHVNVDDDWNYAHNLMYGVANLMEEGKLAKARELSMKLPGSRGETAKTLDIGWARDGITRVSPELPVALRTGNWAEVLMMLKNAQPDDKLENLQFLAGQLKQFATGMEALNTGDLVSAKAASEKLDADLWQMSQKLKDTPRRISATSTLSVKFAVMPDALASPLMANLAIMSLELRGSILAQQTRTAEAKVLFAQAASEEKALGYNEPPAYIRPVAESEGLALLRAGDYAAAHKAYEAALVERPNSGFPLYGLAQSSERAGDRKNARMEYAKFAEAWKDGDSTLPQLIYARQFIAAEDVRSRSAGAN